MYINNLGHMTKMAAMPIYGKNPSKILFYGTGGPISMKLCIKHRWLKYYNVYMNHDPVMTQFMARSTCVAHAFEWGKLSKCHLKGKAGNWQMDRILINLKTKMAQGLHLPLHWG